MWTGVKSNFQKVISRLQDNFGNKKLPVTVVIYYPGYSGSKQLYFSVSLYNGDVVASSMHTKDFNFP